MEDHDKPELAVGQAEAALDVGRQHVERPGVELVEEEQQEQHRQREWRLTARYPEEAAPEHGGTVASLVMPTPAAVVFDLGGVLIEWDRRHLYRKLFDSEDEMEAFLASVYTMEWNDQLDRGRSFAEAVEELAAEHPHHAERIEAYHSRWIEMVAGVMDDPVAIVDELRSRGMRSMR